MFKMKEIIEEKVLKESSRLTRIKIMKKIKKLPRARKVYEITMEKKRKMDEIIRKVVWNKEIRYQLKKHLPCISYQGKDGVDKEIAKLYDGLVQYQINECKKFHHCIGREGFHVGEPWNGDIENAPILFLSSNPSYTFSDVHPRYDAENHKVYCPATFPQRSCSPGFGKVYGGSAQGSCPSIRYSLGGAPFCNICPFRVKGEQCPAQPDGELKIDAVQYYFRTRMQRLEAPLLDGTTKAVPYWTSVLGNTAELLKKVVADMPTREELGREKHGKLAELAREIMRYVVSMEVVPFKSQSEEGIMGGVMDKCWEQFTQRILELAGAKVIVLVGKARTPFLNNFVDVNEKKKAKLAFDQQGIYRMQIGSQERLIVFLKGKQGSMRGLEGYFTGKKSHPSGSGATTFQKLQVEVAKAIPKRMKRELRIAVAAAKASQ